MESFESNLALFMQRLSKYLTTQYGCNVLGHYHKTLSKHETREADLYHAKMICNELRTDYTEVLDSNPPVFICCVMVEIDDADYLVSETHGDMNDWDLEEILETQICKTQVLSIGAVFDEGKKYRTFKWLAQSDEIKVENKSPKYKKILDYFDRKPFGTEGMVLTLLSVLPPTDRCNILELLFEKHINDIEMYNKLSMAYTKAGLYQKSINILNDGHKRRVLDNFNYNALVEKNKIIAQAIRENPSLIWNSTKQSISVLNGQLSDQAFGPYKEFYQILVEFCELHKE